MTSISDLVKFLEDNPKAAAHKPSDLTRLLEEFVKANDDPARSPNFSDKKKDAIDPFFHLLADPALEAFPDLVVLVLKTLKILSRKGENRKRFLAGQIKQIVGKLERPLNTRVTSEGANVILNLCYEKQNVDALLDANGVPPLVSCLASKDLEVVANAAGALQSICFQETGKKVVRDFGAIPGLVALLDHKSSKIKARATGAIHNLSTDVGSIKLIRGCQGIPMLIDSLKAKEPTISGSAAGAIQNLSREEASRALVLAGGAVQPLADLLCGNDVPTQACALGALMNILGPTFGPSSTSADKRAGFRKILTNALALGMIYHGLFTPNTDDDAILKPL